MSVITLISESGRWKYKTKTTDPLFAPILGSMVEGGLELPSELIIPGSLGEALDREWKYIAILQQWEEWEQECNERAPIVYNTEVGIFSTLQRSIPNAPPLVLYRDVEVLSKALDFPEGWESHTLIDETSPLIDRVNHMKSSLLYLRKNPSSSLIHVRWMVAQSTALASRSRDPIIWYTTKNDYGVTVNYYGSLLEPFFRNVYLSQLDNKDVSKLAFPILLDQLDFEAIITYLIPYKDSNIFGLSTVIHLANTMLGRTQDPCVDYGLHFNVWEEGIGFGYNTRFNAEEDNSLLSRLYTRLLSHIPLEAHPKKLGLETILTPSKTGIPKLVKGSDALELDKYVALTDVVAWVNATIVTQKIIDRGSYMYSGDVLDTVVIKRTMFTGVITLLGNTIGLHAMRRMVLSLLYYLEKNKEKAAAPPKARRGVVSQNVQTAHSNLKLAVERAELFANALEKYLEEHEGEDEEVKELRVVSSV